MGSKMLSAVIPQNIFPKYKGKEEVTIGFSLGFKKFGPSLGIPVTVTTYDNDTYHELNREFILYSVVVVSRPLSR